MRPALLLALVATSSLAEEPFASRFTVGLETLGAISLTQVRTQGGFGGGVHASFSLGPQWQVHAKAAWLWGLGSHTLVRVGGGWQREGTWRPLLSANLALGLGGALDVGTPDRLPARGPTLGAMLGAALLRWEVDGLIVSALEVEAGLSTEFLATGFRAGVTVFSLGARL
ncbi:MAG: hypothetical protein JNJ54_16965 [Myxococcaceae bacterium]|nr:hypothetical protein [Myxococcaceae bacterium]